MDKINLYMDDLRSCPQGFVLARSGEECVQLLQDVKVHILSLDHNLDWDKMDGYEVAKFMVDHQIYADEIYLHSSNPVGRERMYHLLKGNKPKNVKLYPHPMPPKVLHRISENT